MVLTLEFIPSLLECSLGVKRYDAPPVDRRSAARRAAYHAQSPRLHTAGRWSILWLAFTHQGETWAAVSAPNTLKELFKAGKVALGMNVRLARSGDIARIAKTTGHDFIFIDGQHSLFTLESIGHIAQTALAIGIAPVVRVRSCDDPDTQALLDNGVTGIVFPDVNNAAEAKRAVSRQARRRHYPSSRARSGKAAPT